jgi:hypothetical protein
MASSSTGAREPLTEKFVKILTVLSSLLGYIPTALVALLIAMVLPVLRVTVSADFLPSEPVERWRNSSCLNYNPRTVVMRRGIPETIAP